MRVHVELENGFTDHLLDSAQHFGSEQEPGAQEALPKPLIYLRVPIELGPRSLE